MFENVYDAINWIENIKRKDPRKDLSRIIKILNDFNNPQENFSKVHVAGTNGKGSVCQILNSCLSKKYKVGVFTSPYIVSFNERIKINDEFINDEDLLKYINTMYKYFIEFEKNGDIIPFFELIFVISLLYFKDKKVDIAIIEVGVGGLLDCTNCFKYEVSAITNISLDHTAYLGDTLESIASHKLGILKEENIFYTTVDESMIPFFKKHCRKIKVRPNFILDKEISNTSVSLYGSKFTYNGFDFKTSLIGVHQVKNVSLAIAILNDYFKFSYFEINKFIKEIYFNGRFEVINKKPLIIVDGAHNVDGIKALIETVEEVFDKKVNFCFAAMKDKDSINMIEKIDKVAKTISFTQINYYRTTEVSEFKSSIDNVYYYKSVNELTEEIKKMNEDDIVIFTGSLYFISEIRNSFK